MEPRYFLVRASKNPHKLYCLSRCGDGPVTCHCKWAKHRERSRESLKPCRHVREVIAGHYIEAQPKPPALRVVGSEGVQVQEAA